MAFLVGVTRPGWVTTLRAIDCEGEVNFWRPGHDTVPERHFGKPLVFVEKGTEPRRIVGRGTIVGFQQLTVEEAWHRWGRRNGVDSLLEFKEKAQGMVKSTSANGGGVRLRGVQVDETHVIGCLILNELTLLPPKADLRTDEFFSSKYALPPFPKNAVKPMLFAHDLPPIFPKGSNRDQAKSRARGFNDLPADARKAIEDRATSICIEYFKGWTHQDVSTPSLASFELGVGYPGFDSVFTRGAGDLNVEIKGTKSSPAVVKLTDNEVRAAVRDERVRLFVVSGIALRREAERWIADGGTGKLYRWRNLDRLGTLLATLDTLDVAGMSLASSDWDVEVDKVEFLEQITSEAQLNPRY